MISFGFGRAGRSCAILLVLAGGAPTSAPAPPRITVIVLDDVGWELLQCANTPHLDALAGSGVTFTQAWAYPSCSPARAALLTGRHAWRTGVGKVLSWVLPATNRGLDPEEVTFAELLPERAEAFGKWHVNHRHIDPNVQGFAHYAGGLFNLGEEGGEGYYHFVKTIDGRRVRSTRYATVDTTDDALASTATLRLVAYHAIHSPAEPPPGGVTGSDLDVTLDMLEFLDREIGRLLAGEDGYVFVISDNGSEKQYGGAKGTMREGGLRVPFFVAGPGIAPAVSDEVVSIVDIFKTLAELRGVTVPPGIAEDSVSLLPILHGGPGERETVYAERFSPNHTLWNRRQAIRDARYKIVYRPTDQIVTLFAMPDDTMIPPPWNAEERDAIARLFGKLPN